MGKKKKSWIQKAIKRPGRIRKYLKRLFGKKALTKDGDIKTEYIDKAINHVKHSKMDKKKKKSLLSALYLAKRLKKMNK